MGKVRNSRRFLSECFSFSLGFACIHLAAMFGHTTLVAYLIAKGQDVNLIDNTGCTPLMHSALRNKG